MVEKSATNPVNKGSAVSRRFSVAPMMDWITKALIHLGLL